MVGHRLWAGRLMDPRMVPPCLTSASLTREVPICRLKESLLGSAILTTCLVVIAAEIYKDKILARHLVTVPQKSENLLACDASGV